VKREHGEGGWWADTNSKSSFGDCLWPTLGYLISMKLGDLGEFGLIERFKAGAIVRDDPGLVGIGDDCAVFRVDEGRDTLLTTDMLTERVHFLRERTTPRQLGRKSISVNLSDIAACGGEPKEALVAVAIPDGISVEYFDELFAGMRECAHQYGVNIIGGDTTSSPRDLVISVTLVGSVARGRAVLRSGAREGDRIFLTGPVGDSAAGLDIIKNHSEIEKEFAELVLAHLDPTPHVHEGQTIGASGLATAMIDLSDGLTVDLGHICHASGLGARIHWDRIPRSTGFREYITRTDLDEKRLALSGGEDYVLLLTVDHVHKANLTNLLATDCHRPIYDIGSMTARTGIELILPDGTSQSPPGDGWDHFRRVP